MADYNKMHQGQHRQSIGDEEAQAQRDAGLTPGITPDLHAPEIANPAEQPETNLHGDVPGSPYSSTPGEMSLGEAAAKEQADATPAADDADTRAREVESRRTGVPTEQLAAEDEAEGNEKPGPRTKRSSKQ